MLHTKVAIVSKMAPNMLCIKFKSDCLVEKEDVIEIDSILLSLADKGDYFVLVDALNVLSNMTTEAQRYFSKQSVFGKRVIATAILVNNLPIRLTATIFIKFQQPEFPTKIFRTKKEALNWFKEFES